MASEYLIAIIHKSTGQITNSWEPGLQVEKDFKHALIQRIRDKGIGVFRTEAHVLADVENAIDELLFDLKSMV